jgi:transcription initiation factor TFIIIB Brf1 subunit/transcription initiation factor TFIIB
MSAREHYEFNIFLEIRQKTDIYSEILDKGRRTENGESQRKVAASLGMKESTLRNRLKLVSTIN